MKKKEDHKIKELKNDCSDEDDLKQDMEGDSSDGSSKVYDE